MFQRKQTDYGYLQHGNGKGSFRTEKVAILHECGDKWVAYYMNRWRRVYIQGNRTYIVVNKEKITIQIDGVSLESSPDQLVWG